MTCSDSLYPSLGRYFKSQTELAHAANKSRTYIWECLNGQRKFTRADKKAISANIALKLMNSKTYDYQELEDANRAWKGEFDEVYRRKDESGQ